MKSIVVFDGRDETGHYAWYFKRKAIWKYINDENVIDLGNRINGQIIKQSVLVVYFLKSDGSKDSCLQRQQHTAKRFIDFPVFKNNSRDKNTLDKIYLENYEC